MSMQSWSWWTRPRCVAFGGKTYVGVIDGSTPTVRIYDGQNTLPTAVAVTALGESDDHDNPALIIAPGKPLIAVYAKHSADALLRYKISNVNIESGVDFTGQPEGTITAGGNVTYAVATVHNGNIYVMFRITGGTWTWAFVKSTDWGVTWTAPVTLFSSAYQFYGGSVLSGDTWRVSMTNHPANGNPPDQNIYYAEINLLTGSVTTSDGTVLGNMSGTSLPISLASLERVAAPTSGDVTWVYDVSDGTNPAVVWGSYTPGSLSTTSRYNYSVRVSGIWQTSSFCTAGNYFTTGEEPYLGGGQIPVGGPDGTVYVCREASGTWTLERWYTPNNGGSWGRQILLTRTSGSLVRAWPVERRDTTSTFEVFADEITAWTSYTNHTDTIIPVQARPGDWVPLVAEKFDGSTWQPLVVERWSGSAWVDVPMERNYT